MKYALFLAIAVLFLAACTTEAPASDDVVLPPEPVVPGAEEPTTAPEPAEEPKMSSDYDVEIIAGRLEPRDFTVPVNEVSTITFHNKQAYNVRIDILMRENSVSETIPADSYRVVQVEPTQTGQVSIDLNGQQMGSLTAE